MAAYAALVSLANLLVRILRSPRDWILLDREVTEKRRVKIRSSQDFLKNSSHKFDQAMEDRISLMYYTACESEDFIESSLKDSSSQISQGIQERIKEFDLFEATSRPMNDILGPRMNQRPVTSFNNGLPIDQNTFVGLDPLEGKMFQVMDKLVVKKSSRQVITITGMGGIGKTTLAKCIYENPGIVEHFDVRAWVVISQEFSVREILLALLSNTESTKREGFKDDAELGQRLHQSLCGMRYLIVMDDMWSDAAWNEYLRKYFPDNGKGSRILITTRLSNVAKNLNSVHTFDVDFLDKDQSWDLFRVIVFGQGDYPSELIDIGKNIAKSCRGLPLAIVVIGGLLKSNATREYWECVVKNLNSTINTEGEEYCLKVLSLSYYELPVYLKPCFLYMATIREDGEIKVSRLINLWIAEGFIKPDGCTRLEDVALGYINELMLRNLILVRKRGTLGKLKSCGVHDLLRDLCLREAQKENFLCVTKTLSPVIPQSLNNQHRLIFHPSPEFPGYVPESLTSERSFHFARSMMCEFECISPLLLLKFKSLRILDVVDKYLPGEIMHMVNLRYVHCMTDHRGSGSTFPSSISLFWNLQFLIIGEVSTISPIILPPEIWKMSQLRHVECKPFALIDPPRNEKDSCILVNLQTLGTIKNFSCVVGIVKRVSNLKQLKITCELSYDKEWSCFSLDNLAKIDELESLSLRLCKQYRQSANISCKNLAFPRTLKKLSLDKLLLPWADISVVGSLPSLEVLKLRSNAFSGEEWVPNDGEFSNLKYLEIDRCDGLRNWIADENHYPKLEQLVLKSMNLKQLPVRLENHPLLVSVVLNFCGESTIIWAEQVLEKRMESGNDDLRVEVTINVEMQDMLTLIEEMQDKLKLVGTGFLVKVRHP